MFRVLCVVIGGIAVFFGLFRLQPRRNKERLRRETRMRKEKCDREQILQLTQRLRDIAGGMRQVIAIDDGMTMRMIGEMGDEDPPFNYIFIVECEGFIIPFRMHSPEVRLGDDGIPVVKVVVSHIGYDLRAIYNSPREETGPRYDRMIFPDNIFHGYIFHSQEEYKVMAWKIQRAVRDMLQRPCSDGRPICVCKKVKIVADATV